MSENDFEDVDCVTFDNDPRTWILKEKIHENKSQLDKMEFDGTHVASKSWEVYICENSADPSEEAIIKIYKQYVFLLGTPTVANSLTEFLILDPSLLDRR